MPSGRRQRLRRKSPSTNGATISSIFINGQALGQPVGLLFAQVPEPGTPALVGLAAAGLASRPTGVDVGFARRYH